MKFSGNKINKIVKGYQNSLTKLNLIQIFSIMIVSFIQQDRIFYFRLDIREQISYYICVKFLGKKKKI